MDLRTLLRGRFESSPVLAGKLRDTSVDGQGKVVRGNYLLLFTTATPSELLTERLARPQAATDEARWEWTLRAVAVDVDGVNLLLGAAFSLLVGWQPTIPGSTPQRVRFEGSEPVVADRALTPPLYFGETDYSVRI